MAFQVQQQSQFQELLGVLRRRLWQIILPMAFVLSLGIAAAIFVPYKYKVRTVIELRPVQVSSFEDVGRDQLMAYNRSFANPNLQIMHFERVRRVLEKQEWDDYVTLPRDEQIDYLQRVLRNINVRVRGGNTKNLDAPTFIDILYTDTSGARAEVFVNSLRDAYVEDVVERYRREMREERDKLQELRTEADIRLREAEKRLSDYRREHGLSLTRITDQEEDFVFKAYEEARLELDRTTRKLEGLLATRAKLEEQYEDAPEEVLDRVIDAGTSTAVEESQLELDILRLKREQEGYRPLHSRYKQLEYEILDKEQELERVRAVARRATVEEKYVPNPDKPSLYQELLASDREIERLRAEKERLDFVISSKFIEHTEQAEVLREVKLMRLDVDAKQEAYQDANRAYRRMADFVSLIQGPEGDPFDIEREGYAPRSPSEPSRVMIIGLAAFLGLGVGIGSAMLAEYSRSCFRSVNDIARVMSVPVLGAINVIETRLELRRKLLMRFAIGSSSIALIGSILVVAVIWQRQPNLLPLQVQEVIEDLRLNFR